jgi:hypothetical protein
MTATIEQRNPTPEHHIVSREEWIMGRKQLLAKEKESTRRIHGRKQALRPKTASQAILVSTAVESCHATDEGEYPARWSCGTRIFTTAST